MEQAISKIDVGRPSDVLRIACKRVAVDVTSLEPGTWEFAAQLDFLEFSEFSWVSLGLDLLSFIPQLDTGHAQPFPAVPSLDVQKITSDILNGKVQRIALLCMGCA